MEHENRHILGYRFNSLIWIDLLILTMVTIEIAQFDFRELTVVVALLVASVKTFLVGSYFMHLKFESRIFRVMVGITALVFITFLAFLFIDYSFR